MEQLFPPSSYEKGVRNMSSLMFGKSKSIMAERLSKVLPHKDFLSLPRIQVVVDVSSPTLDIALDTDLLEKIVPKVVKQLASADFGGAGCLEESELKLELLPDLSVRCCGGPPKLRAYSPERPSTIAALKKMRNSPATRKLVLGEEDEAGVLPSMRTLAVAKTSEIGAVVLVEREGPQMFVVNLILACRSGSEKHFPTSPTTGLPFIADNGLLGQMSTARCGFGLVAIGDAILSIGGFNRHGVLSSSERYDVIRNCWEPAGNMAKKRARFAAVALEGTLYAIGGSDGKKELGCCEAFDMETQNWTTLSAKMLTPRSCFGAAAVGGMLYTIGGVHYSTPLKRAEVYSPGRRQWQPIPHMHTARSDLAVVECGGKVYAIGGQKSDWSCVASAECYDPETCTWTNIASMKIPRRNAAAVTIDGKIFVIGGYNGSRAVNALEVFCPEEGKWSTLSPTSVQRSSASVVYHSGSVYISGGYSGAVFLNSMERYDLKEKQWYSYL